MNKITSYRDLLVWQRATLLAEDDRQNSEDFPCGEEIGLKAQMRRAAVSVPSNVAEGHTASRDGVHPVSLRRPGLAC
jgi:four helix bundle protein